MKTIEEKAALCAKEKVNPLYDKNGKSTSDIKQGYKAGGIEVQEFIPIEEEEPPYGEDVLVQTPAGSIYFGKMHDGTNGRPDYFHPDLASAEWNLKINQIKSWRPIFYK